MGSFITGYGKAQPKLVASNESLEQIVDTSDEWIYTRTGIKERRICVKESMLDLAYGACIQALGIDRAEFDEGINVETSGRSISKTDPEDVDLIIMTTITPDTIVPSGAAALKKKLGATSAIAFDINAACTGFIYGLSIAENMMRASNDPALNGAEMLPIRRALVVSSERMSRLIDWKDRNTCVLFGDGAGAAVLEWSDEKNDVLSLYMKNDDDEANSLTCLHAFDAIAPFDAEGVIKDNDQNLGEGVVDQSVQNIRDYFDIEPPEEGHPSQCIYMNGQKVFKFASKAMEHAVRQAAELAHIDIDEIDLIVPHQANYRIIEYAAKRLDMPIDKMQISIEHTGNSSSSCLPMALVDAIEKGRAKKGDIVCLVAFGGGLTSGAAIIRI